MRTIALRRLAEINPSSPEFDGLPANADVLFLPLETVWSDSRADQSRLISKAAVESGYTRFNAGDTVTPKVTPTFQAGRSMLTRRAGAGTTELHVLRARPGVDARWVTYAVRSKHFLEEGVTAFQGVAGLQRVPHEYIANFRVADVIGEEQRRIADFLDDRVARIDQVIVARRHQISCVQAIGSSSLQRELSRRGLPAPRSVEVGWRGGELPLGWRSTTFGRVLRQLTNGYVGPTRDILAESGIRYIQSTHIKDGQIDFSRRPFYVTEEWHSERPRIHLQAGDILIVQTGDIGQTALVPEDFGPASCHALLIARVDRRLVRPEYLTELLRSEFGQAAMLARATGALHPHLEAGVKSVPVVLPRLGIQGEIAARLVQHRHERSAVTGRLQKSIGALSEYKQSLITAAVTGEIDVTTAGSGIQG